MTRWDGGEAKPFSFTGLNHTTGLWPAQVGAKNLSGVEEQS